MYGIKCLPLVPAKPRVAQPHRCPTSGEPAVKYLRTALFVVALLCTSFGTASAASPGDTALIVVTEGDTLVLTVPVSKVHLSIPRGNLTRYEEPGSGATASPRYFQFRDDAKGLVISGWFESESSWQSWKKFLAGEFAGLIKSEYPPSKDPESVTAGPWHGFSYDVDLKSAKSANLRVELFKAGTWIDLHISVTSVGSITDARSQAMAFLKKVEVKKKP